MRLTAVKNGLLANCAITPSEAALPENNCRAKSCFGVAASAPMGDEAATIESFSVGMPL